MSFTRVSAFVHRASILLTALAAAAVLIAQNQGADLGLTSTEVAGITAGAVAVSTILRSLTDAFNRTTETFEREIQVLREALRSSAARGDIRPPVEAASVEATIALESDVRMARIPND